MTLRSQKLGIFTALLASMLLASFAILPAFAQGPPPPPPPPTFCSATDCSQCTQAECSVTAGCQWDPFSNTCAPATAPAPVPVQPPAPVPNQPAANPPNPISVPQPNITSFNDFYLGLKAIALWVLVFGIILGVLFVIIGAISILTSGGDERKLTSGKATITWAIVGVVVLVLSYTIVNVIAGIFGVTTPVITP